jgi:hypothetical protein
MKVINVEYVENYKIKLQFSDKKVKIVNLESELVHPKGVFIPLKDLDYFKNVSLDDDKISICWPNGADFCPDLLYQIGEDISPSKRKAKKQLRVPKSRKKLKTGIV